MGLKHATAYGTGITSTGCEPTYMGLKPHKIQHVFNISLRLRAYLYGIETQNGHLFQVMVEGCEPTYMGLKLFSLPV